MIRNYGQMVGLPVTFHFICKYVIPKLRCKGKYSRKNLVFVFLKKRDLYSEKKEE